MSITRLVGPNPSAAFIALLGLLLVGGCTSDVTGPAGPYSPGETEWELGVADAGEEGCLGHERALRFRCIDHGAAG